MRLGHFLFAAILVFNLSAFAQLNSQFSKSSSSGCIDHQINFTSLATGGPVNWDWDFGDGTTSTDINPTHVYVLPGSYTITLVVTDVNGLTDSWSDIYAVRPPKAKFALAPSVGCAIPHTVFFTDQSTLPDTWFWKFGDGSTSTLQNPVHNYTSTGSFTVILTTTDTIYGCVDSDTSIVEVGLPNALIGGPIGEFGCGPLTVNFTDASSNSGSGTITNYLWDFGDGSTSTMQNPNYVYDTPGIYTVSLTVTNSLGCTSTDVNSNYVQVIGPDVNFGADITFSDCPDLTVNFTDSTIFSAPIVAWNWNFGDATTSNTQNPTHTYTDFGSYDVTLTIQDIDGCSRTLVFEDYIDVQDTIPPVFNTCPLGQTEDLSASCNFVLPDYTGIGVVSDNCTSSLPLTQDPAPGTIVTTNQLITLETIDDQGNIATCDFNVILVDGTAPIISCPSNQNVSFDASCGYTLLDYTGLATASDNCLTPTVTQLPAMGTIITSTQTVTLTATDTAGNTSTCQFDVIPVDDTAPTISCPSDQNVSFDASCGYTLLDYTGLATANDNCLAPTITQSPIAGTVITTIQTITLTATDGAGNVMICNFDVIPTDNTPPTISCPADQNVSFDANCAYTLLDYSGLVTANDNCLTPTVTQSPIAGTVITTTQTIIMTATDAAGNTVTCNFDVIPADNADPTIVCPADQNVNFDVNCGYTLLDYTGLATANDNCTTPIVTQSLVAGTVIAVTQTITLTATDVAGNMVTCNFDVIPTDNTVPTIVCPSDIEVNNDLGVCGAVVTYGTPVGIDNCTSTTTLTAGLADGNLFPIGITTNTFEVIDGAGLSAECSFDVTVVDGEFPILTCGGNIVVDNDPGECDAVVTYTDPIFSDNCGTTGLVQIAGLTSGSSFPVGVTTNSFEITDESGNTSTCSFDIIVEDNEMPTIICPENITTCEAISIFDEPTIIDNCNSLILTLISGVESGDEFPVGITTNLYEVIDGVGNQTTCSFDITRYAIPTLDVGTDLTINAGDSAQIEAISDLGAYFEWTPEEGLSNPTSENPKASPLETTTYSLLVTTEEGCQNSTELTVNVNLEILISNYMSPNSDGVNDTWIIKGAYILDECQIEIYDSWGNQVYNSIGYKNDWDGNREGDQLPDGVYYYVIACSSDNPLTGSITLIR